MASCFFIGHHDAPDTLLPLLLETVERHYSCYAVRSFTVGMYGSFDRMAARAVMGLKQRCPVTLSLLLPYHPFERPIPAPEGFDNTFYPPGMEDVPKRAAIVRANRYMIAHSDYLIAYDRGQIGNTRDLVAYARRREGKGQIHVENLAERMGKADWVPTLGNPIGFIP